MIHNIKHFVLLAICFFVSIETNAQVSTNPTFSEGLKYEIQIGSSETVSAYYSFGKGLSLGVGTGFVYRSVALSYPTHEAKMIVPYFAEARYNFLDKKVSPFVDVRYGGFSDYRNKGVGNIAIGSIGSDFGKHFAVYVGVEYLCEKQKIADNSVADKGISYTDVKEKIVSAVFGVAFRF